MLLSTGLALAGEKDAPHQFYGSVTTNGEPAADGLLIQAKIDDSVVASTVTKDGFYGYLPDIFYVPDDATNRYDEIIVFYLKDKSNVFHEVGTSDFVNAGSSEIDFSANGNFVTTTTTPTTTTTSTSTSSAPKSSGGAALAPRATTTDSNSSTETLDDTASFTSVNSDCTPDWYCSEWEDCLASKQKRTCIDNNNCGVEDAKPLESQSCEILSLEDSIKIEQRSDSAFNRITGAVIGGGIATWIFFIVLVGLIAGLFFFVIAKRKSKK